MGAGFPKENPAKLKTAKQAFAGEATKACFDGVVERTSIFVPALAKDTAKLLRALLCQRINNVRAGLRFPMTDDDGLWHHKELPWFAHQTKIRELFDKQALDAERFSIEFTKLILSNLFLLNAGGIGVIPTVAAFVGANTLTWNNKVEFLSRPGILFIVGALASVVSMFFVYLNYQAMAGHARALSRMELGGMNKTHPIYGTNEEYTRQVDEYFDSGKLESVKLERWLSGTFWAAFVSGATSAILFLGGCYYFTDIVQRIHH